MLVIFILSKLVLAFSYTKQTDAEYNIIIHVRVDVPIYDVDVEADPELISYNI